MPGKIADGDPEQSPGFRGDPEITSERLTTCCAVVIMRRHAWWYSQPHPLFFAHLNYASAESTHISYMYQIISVNYNEAGMGRSREMRLSPCLDSCSLTTRHCRHSRLVTFSIAQFGDCYCRQYQSHHVFNINSIKAFTINQQQYLQNITLRPT
jgi:hypothetical protein